MFKEIYISVSKSGRYYRGIPVPVPRAEVRAAEHQITRCVIGADLVVEADVVYIGELELAVDQYELLTAEVVHGHAAVGSARHVVHHLSDTHGYLRGMRCTGIITCICKKKTFRGV